MSRRVTRSIVNSTASRNCNKRAVEDVYSDVYSDEDSDSRKRKILKKSDKKLENAKSERLKKRIKKEALSSESSEEDLTPELGVTRIKTEPVTPAAPIVKKEIDAPELRVKRIKTEPVTPKPPIVKKEIDAPELGVKRIKTEPVTPEVLIVKKEIDAQSSVFDAGLKIKQENGVEPQNFDFKIKTDPVENDGKKIDVIVSGVVKKDPDCQGAGVKSENVCGAKCEGKKQVYMDTNFSRIRGERRDKPPVGSGVLWEADMLAEKENLSFGVAKNLVSLFKNDCTVPFIARYRQELTDKMDADTLRHVKDSYTKIKTFEAKVQSVLNQLKKTDVMTPEMERSVLLTRNQEELEHFYAPFKPGGRKTKAEKARQLGLENIAISILEGRYQVQNLDKYVNPSKEGLKSTADVAEGIKHIMAEVFSKDTSVLEYLRNIQNKANIMVVSKAKIVSEKLSKAETKKEVAEDPEGKYRTYYDFSVSVHNIQPHQVLALNRGENQKMLSVKFVVPDWLMDKLRNFCFRKWMSKGYLFPLRSELFEASFKDSYARLIQPLVIRRVKSHLNDTAERAAVENFASNLKHLLLTPPVRGSSILGIDPGYTRGCKMALISGYGDVLWTDVMYVNLKSPEFVTAKDISKLKQQLVIHKCELIALGNGTGCREMEECLSRYISSGFFAPELEIQYTIVNERGASTYSCTPLAKEEFPTMDPNLISAVFIARSLQDPLSELVKVEPKHLGVGMYQHDLPEKQLSQTLDEIVVECVSFSGVDINTASLYLLRRIAGLNKKQAANLIEFRNKNGPFVNRKELLQVKGIGDKTYEQCIGFIRIIPETALPLREKNDSSKSNKRNQTEKELIPLDRTWIHPESYSIAEKFVKMCGVRLSDLGTPDFIQKVHNVFNSKGIDTVSNELNTNVSTIAQIYEALIKPLDHDYRSQFSKPVFKKGVTSITSIHPNMELTGYVTNVTDFGAFVDIGVYRNGLIHKSKYGIIRPEVGHKVLVKVLEMDTARNRIGLQLLSRL